MYLLCPIFQSAAKWNGVREFSTSTKRLLLAMYILCAIFQLAAKQNGLREFGTSTERLFLVMYILCPIFNSQQNAMDYASLAHQLKDYF